MNSLPLFLTLLLSIYANVALAAPDEDLLGKAKGYPIGAPYQWITDESVRVGALSNDESLLPFHTLTKADSASTLSKAKDEPAIQYSFNGQSYSIDDYLQHQRVTGLLIIRDGVIQVERYQYDREPTQRFLSMSMAKSIVSLAVGFALDEGKIQSLDDKAAKYVPELVGYPYGETSIRNLLRMASGVKFNESYSGKDDDDFSRFGKIRREKSLMPALQAFGERNEKEGTHFSYASSNTNVLALVIKASTGESLSDYVDEKLWKPMGAESDAKWSIDPQGNEYAHSEFNATLRDWGRLGVLLANDGAANGKRIIPRSYLMEATDWHKQPESFAPGKVTPSLGYGYQFWILPGEKRRFLLHGVYGQTIYINPELKLVMVQTAVEKRIADAYTGDSLNLESLTLWEGLEHEPN